MDKIRTLLVAAYPIQNVEPHRLLAKTDGLEVTVAYCANPAANLKKDKEFINQQQFDIDVWSKDYPWVLMENFSPRPGLSKFYGLINPGVIGMVLRNQCIVVYGHAYVTFWLAILSALLFGKRLILTTDATYLESPDNKKWKLKIKKWFFPLLYNQLADKVWVPSSESGNFLKGIGVKPSRIEVTPYTVDNTFITSKAGSGPDIRKQLGIPQDAVAAIFCAKFIDRKRPQDALTAFAKCNLANTYLIMVGDGPLKSDLTALVKTYQVTDKVIFTGLVSYSVLPAYYAAADFLVFTSETEQFGLPVNEAMLCGLPVLISDRIGCRLDLVDEGKNGFTYPCGDTGQLTEKMKLLFRDQDLRKAMSKRSLEIIKNWSPETNAGIKYLSIRSLFPGSSL